MVAKQSTTKKKPASKTTARKSASARVSKPAARKTVAKATPVKRKTTARKSSAKRPERMVSFRIYRDAAPFTSTSITKQTVYWAILLVVIVLMQLWILKIQVEIADLTNSILSQNI